MDSDPHALPLALPHRSMNSKPRKKSMVGCLRIACLLLLTQTANTTSDLAVIMMQGLAGPSDASSQYSPSLRYIPAIRASFGPPLPALGLSGNVVDLGTDACSLSTLLETMATHFPELLAQSRRGVDLESASDEHTAATGSISPSTNYFLSLPSSTWGYLQQQQHQQQGKSGAFPFPWIALVERGNCSFDLKAYHVQLVGASAIIIFNDEPTVSAAATGPNDPRPLEDRTTATFPGQLKDFYGLVQMTPSRYGHAIHIQSLFIARRHALQIRAMMQEPAGSQSRSVLTVHMYALRRDEVAWSQPSSSSYFDYHYPATETYHDLFRRLLDDLLLSVFLMLCATSAGTIVALVALSIARFRYMRNLEQVKIRNRMTLAELKALPCTPWQPASVKPGQVCMQVAIQEAVMKQDTLAAASASALVEKDQDGSPLCAICLDGLVVGDPVRNLPCHHVFHASCVDDWLLKRHKSCPVCRRDATQIHSSVGLALDRASPGRTEMESTSDLPTSLSMASLEVESVDYSTPLLSMEAARTGPVCTRQPLEASFS